MNDQRHRGNIIACHKRSGVFDFGKTSKVQISVVSLQK